MADQMKLVTKPPQRTTMSTGRFCQRSARPVGEQMNVLVRSPIGLPAVESEGEEGAHDAGEDGDDEALAEGVVALAGFGLFFRR